MIDHISLEVRDLARSKAFYEKLLEPLGMNCLVDAEVSVGFGKRYPEVWLNLRPDAPIIRDRTGMHVCLRARTKEAVSRFHEAALEHGGRCDGAPGDRQAAFTTYFGAFVRDPDGNKLEAVTFPQPE